MQLKNVLITAPDLDRALASFSTLSAAPVAFRDGDQYAVLDPGAARLGVAFATPDDHPAPGELVLTAKAEHVEQAAAALVADGGEIVHPAYRGGHEVRALVRTAGGFLVMIYGPEQ